MSKPQRNPPTEIVRRRPESEVSSNQHSFRHFSELPDEIQIQIWQIAISASRIVKIKYRGEDDWKHPSMGLLSIMTPHFIDSAWRQASQICSRSREEARRDGRKFYDIHKGSMGSCPLLVSMDIKTDILLFNDTKDLYQLAQTQLQQRNERALGGLKYLALELSRTLQLDTSPPIRVSTNYWR
jgi:hypothetical protein